LTKSTKLIKELFDNYVSNYLTSYGSPYLTIKKAAFLTQTWKSEHICKLSTFQ